MERNAGDGHGLVHAVVNRGPRPNGSPDAAKRPLRHRRTRPIGVVSVTSPDLLPTPSAIRNPRLVPRARRGLDESPVTLRVFVWTERRARCTGRVLPMRQAHRSGTRRCSYRFCHRDRSASTRPMCTNLAGPAGTPWQGSPRITPVVPGCPDPPSAVPNASGFEPGAFEPVPSPAVSPQGPVPNVQPVRVDPVALSPIRSISSSSRRGRERMRRHSSSTTP